jgi:hypothetical protein
VDALALSHFEHPENEYPVLNEWYELLSCGFRVPLVGGVTKNSNCDNIGEVRTYARLLQGQEFNYAHWIEAVRAGRTFVTSGPFLNLTVNGQGPGSDVDLPEQQATVHVRAEARSLVPFEKVEVVVNGSTVGVEDVGVSRTAVFEGDLPIPLGGWLTARCLGGYEDVRADHVGAQTSPVYATVGGVTPRPDLAVLAKLTDHLDHMLEWVRSRGRFENDAQRDRLAGIFLSAKEELERRAKRELR